MWSNPFRRRLSAEDIRAAFTELGQLAHERGTHLILLVIGGAAMVLGYQSRPSTYDVDAVWSAADAQVVRDLAAQVAAGRGWPKDWLNDGAKGFVAAIQPVQWYSLPQALRFTCPGRPSSSP
jgi:hypothetical protein